MQFEQFDAYTVTHKVLQALPSIKNWLGDEKCLV